MFLSQITPIHVSVLYSWYIHIVTNLEKVMEFLLTKYLGFSPSWHSLRAISITMLVHNHFLLSQPLLSNLSLLLPPSSLILWFHSQGVNLARWGSEGGRHPSDLKVRGGAYAGVQRRAPDLPTGGIALPSRFISDMFFPPSMVIMILE